MKRYATYKEVCEEIKKVFAAKGYKNNKMNFTYDLKEYLLTIKFYKSRWCGPWGGDLYGDYALSFYEMHPNDVKWVDFQDRIFETKFDEEIDLDKMRENLLDSLKICDEIIERGVWTLFKEKKIYYGLYPRETVSYIYEKTGVKLR